MKKYSIIACFDEKRHIIAERASTSLEWKAIEAIAYQVSLRRFVECENLETKAKKLYGYPDSPKEIELP